MQSLIIQKIIYTNSLSITDIFIKQGRIYTFLNPVSYLYALDNKKLFGKFDGIFVDGSILVSAIRLLYRKKVHRRSFDMTSLAPELFAYAEKKGKSIYLIASKQIQIKKAMNVFCQSYPNLNFVGYRNGFFSSTKEMEEEVKHICNLAPDFLIVGMGVLTQEKFLLKVKDAGFKGIGITCGGFIHQTAENEVCYYPIWIDRMNLRFLYRIYKEPHTRMRYLKAGLIFPARFIYERFFGNR